MKKKNVIFSIAVVIIISVSFLFVVKGYVKDIRDHKKTLIPSERQYIEIETFAADIIEENFDDIRNEETEFNKSNEDFTDSSYQTTLDVIQKETPGLIREKDIKVTSGYLKKTPIRKIALEVTPKTNSQIPNTGIMATKPPKNEDKRSNNVNILVLGTDKTEDREEYLKVYRTDAILLVSINPDKKNVYVISIPRDTYAYLPVIKKWDKINHAYAYGGMKEKGVIRSIEAVNILLGFNVVDYYFLMDMEPFPSIVDDLGGIELNVDIEMKTHGVNLSKGFQLLDGKNAFDYIHWRYSSSGDIGRVKRQQQLIRAIYEKISNDGNVAHYINMVMKYNKYVMSDMSLKQLLSLGDFSRNMGTENIYFHTLKGKSKIINGIWYWLPDSADLKRLVQICR